MLRFEAVVIGVVVLGAGDAWAATITEFTAQETVVFGPVDDVRITGNITHLIGVHNNNIIDNFVGSASDEWKIVGFDGQGAHEVVLNGRLNSATGNGTFAGTSVIRPGDDVDGFWECTAQGQFSSFVARGLSVCHGTGVLEGQHLQVRLSNDTDWDGRIIVPAATGVAAVPEPVSATLAAIALLGVAGLCRRRRERLNHVF